MNQTCSQAGVTGTGFGCSLLNLSIVELQDSPTPHILLMKKCFNNSTKEQRQTYYSYYWILNNAAIHERNLFISLSLSSLIYFLSFLPVSLFLSNPFLPVSTSLVSHIPSSLLLFFTSSPPPLASLSSFLPLPIPSCLSTSLPSFHPLPHPSQETETRKIGL